jgi:hypothetical protein
MGPDNERGARLVGGVAGGVLAEEDAGAEAG